MRTTNQHPPLLLLYACGAVLLFTALVNNGWFGYIPIVVSGGYGFFVQAFGMVYWLLLAAAFTIVLWRLIKFTRAQSGLNALRPALLLGLVFFLSSLASFFTPSRAQLSFHVWRKDFINVVDRASAQFPATELQTLNPALNLDWRLGQASISSGQIQHHSTVGVTIQPYRTVVFNYGPALPSLVYNSTDRPKAHEFDSLCQHEVNRRQSAKKIEANWFICTNYE